MDPSLISQIAGPAGGVVVLSLLVYGFVSGRIRRGADYDDCRAEVKEKDARYATIVPALENFGRGSEAVVAAVSDLDAEIDAFGTRLDALEKQHAEEIEKLKAHYAVQMEAMRSDVREVLRAVGAMNGDVLATQAAVERMEGRPWKGGAR